MIPFYIGNSQQFIAVQYAKSGRSSCRDCKQKIGKDQLRIGILLDDDHFNASYWYHTDCFHFKPRHKVLDVQNLQKMICGISDLNPEDNNKIIEQLKDQLRNFKDNTFKKGKKQIKGGAVKKKEEINKQKQKFKSKSKSKSKAKAKITKQQKQQVKPLKKSRGRGKSTSIQPQISPKKPAISARKTRGRGTSLSVYPQSSLKKQKISVSKSKKTNFKPKKKVAKPVKFITPFQAKQYNELYKDFLLNNALQLKQILGKNFQPKTGNKDELAARCADGRQFGRIPICQKCGGGKLRFNRTNGAYKCPGYMEDTDFKNCSAIFTFDQIKRQQWKD